MATINFENGTVVTADWLNDVDALVYDLLGGVSTAAGVRSALGLVIGTNVQAYDAGLAYLDGLNFTNEATFKAAVNLEIGVDVQAYSAVLAATTASFTTADETKLDAIEALADVTDETNVVAALSGATLTDVGTPAGTDLVLIQDASDSNNLKVVQASTLGGTPTYLDNESQYWGTDNDLQIISNTTDSYIKSVTASNDLHIGAGNQNSINISGDDYSVSFAYDVLFNDDVSIVDNKRIYFGTGITADGSLHFDGSGLYLGTAGANSLVLRTANTGRITIDGTSGESTFAYAISLPDNVLLKLGSSLDGYIYHDGVTDIIYNAATSRVHSFRVNSVEQFYIDASGFYATAQVHIGGQILRDAHIQDYSVVIQTPSISAGALTLNYATGQVQRVTLDQNVTSITVSNPPASGRYGELMIEFTQDATGSRTVAGWPGTINWPGGTAPTITAAANSIDRVYLSTFDGGTTWYGEYSQDYQ